MDKPARPFAKPLRDLLGKVVGDSFTRQGFASAELVTRWTEIAGAEIAAHSEPIKIQWPRADETGVRRDRARWCCGSRARRRSRFSTLPIVICERVNRFLGWRAVERITLRQAPLRRAVRQSARGRRRRGRGTGRRDHAGYRRRRFAGGAWRGSGRR